VFVPIGDLSSGKLKVDDLEVETINGVYVDDWMTTSTNQEILSRIHILGELKLRRDLYTESINDIRLADGVQRTEPNVRISGPLELSSFTLGNLTLAPYRTLNGLHISSAANLRKKHIYWTESGDGLSLDGNIEGIRLESSALNGVPFHSLRDAYWRTNVSNQIPNHFNFGSAKVLVEAAFQTDTLNSAHVETDLVRTSSDGVIRRNLQFSSDVIVNGALGMADGGEINSYDISQVATDIVRTTDGKRRISGRKTFLDWIEAKGGVRLKDVNGLSLERELIFLEGYGTQEIGRKGFRDVVGTQVEADVDVQVDGTLNGEKLMEIRKSTVYEDQERIKIHGNVIFEKSIAGKDLAHAISPPPIEFCPFMIPAEALTVLNEINGIKFGEVVGKVIGLDQEQDLVTPLIISGGKLTFVDSAHVSSINGISPKDYLAKAIPQSTRYITN